VNTEKNCIVIPANINPKTWGIPRFPRTCATIDEKIMTVPTSNTIISIEISLDGSVTIKTAHFSSEIRT